MRKPLAQERIDGFLSIPAFQKFSSLLRQEAPQGENVHPHFPEITEERDQPLPMAGPVEKRVWQGQWKNAAPSAARPRRGETAGKAAGPSSKVQWLAPAPPGRRLSHGAGQGRSATARSRKRGPTALLPRGPVRLRAVDTIYISSFFSGRLETIISLGEVQGNTPKKRGFIGLVSTRSRQRVRAGRAARIRQQPATGKTAAGCWRIGTGILAKKQH